jgi:hypothetical protein
MCRRYLPSFVSSEHGVPETASQSGYILIYAKSTVVEIQADVGIAMISWHHPEVTSGTVDASGGFTETAELRVHPVSRVAASPTSTRRRDY